MWWPEEPELDERGGEAGEALSDLLMAFDIESASDIYDYFVEMGTKGPWDSWQDNDNDWEFEDEES